MNYDAWRHYSRGHLMQAFKLDEAAIEAYRAAFAADPAMVKAARSLGFLLAGRRRFAEAERYLERATALAPEEAYTWFNLGFVRDAEGHRVEAVAAFKEAVRLRPTLDQAWYGLGQAQAALGEHEAAAEALAEAARLQPMNGHAWYALGMAHHHCHRPERVKAVVEHIVCFDPRMARQLIREAERADLVHLVAHLEDL